MLDEAHSSNGQAQPIIENGLTDGSSPFAFTAVPLKDDKFLSLTWAMFFEALDHDEKKKLIDIYARMGVRGVLDLLSKYNDTLSVLVELPQAEQERLLRIHEQMKKGSSELDQKAAESGLTSEDKKAV